jgi:hypothetical protein
MPVAGDIERGIAIVRRAAVLAVLGLLGLRMLVENYRNFEFLTMLSSQ